MKTLILSSIMLVFLASCKKDENISPKTAPIASTTTVASTTTPPVVKGDTIPDGGAIKIQLVKDSVNYDETMFLFKNASKSAYSNLEDAIYFPGFGQESLASISSDGRELAINVLPYTPGMSVGLDANGKSNGAYLFKLSYQKKIPANIQVWIKDTYLKDSVDVRTQNYSFNINKADAKSFGNARFKLILKDSGQHQTNQLH